MTALQQQGALAKDASRILATAGTAKKNAALEAIAAILTQRQDEWLAANAQDIAAAKESGMRPAMLDRLSLTPEIIQMAGGAGSWRGTGGMATKLSAARIAMNAGCDMVITNGERMENLYGIVEGKDIGTRFLAAGYEEERV